MVMFSGQCQAYRAELLILHGAWDDALSVARAAEGRVRKGDPDATFGSWYQQGEVLRLQGFLDEAAKAYAIAAGTGFEPVPGIALLQLAQHKASQAQATMRRALAEADTANRRRLLPAVVEIELALETWLRPGQRRTNYPGHCTPYPDPAGGQPASGARARFPRGGAGLCWPRATHGCPP